MYASLIMCASQNDATQWINILKLCSMCHFDHTADEPHNMRNCWKFYSRRNPVLL